MRKINYTPDYRERLVQLRDDLDMKLLINPEHMNFQGAIVFLNRRNLKGIIHNAEVMINDLPESIRDEVRKGI